MDEGNATLKLKTKKEYFPPYPPRCAIRILGDVYILPADALLLAKPFLLSTLWHSPMSFLSPTTLILSPTLFPSRVLLFSPALFPFVGPSLFSSGTVPLIRSDALIFLQRLMFS